ncbi:MAG TPA: hypothetical protein PKD64_18085 [Pirellulaceae bacterium]|nr:hypothetical protein [Pirellulaceae bacterium]HMO94099.1 hypothetical protein [Pirellulaceae bacterium]HMP71026.1 hypothetical protein [Pirellulaceae bacterium]
MELKPLRRDSIPAAIERAKHYRYLNEPFSAESACLDVLAVEPENQDAIKTLILAIADQFVGGSRKVQEARGYAEKLQSEFDKHYFTGLILERVGKSYITLNTPESLVAAYDRLTQAMYHFEVAATLNNQSHDDAILRWNTCARFINNHNLNPAPENTYTAYGD